ncbi:hypothetical protein E4U41_002967, partial [Claviceps citrina]
MPKGESRDIEATAGAPCHYPGPTLLPSPIAHAVSLATRSTSLMIRLGSFVSCYSLDAARFTTLSSLGLARGLVETVLGRAARDTMTLSCSDLSTAETESILERSLESLHFAVTQIVFWSAAGFRFTGTSIVTVAEASQLLLGSLDKIFGSTDSSRAVASIVTLVRREFNNPATGAEGEKVGVSDLVVALSVLAYLQGASRRSAVEEARRQSQEEVIWDVVVLSDGERVDVDHGQGQAEQRRLASDDTSDGTSELGVCHGANEDDEAIMERLKNHVASNLDPGTTVSISNSVTSVQTITVDVSGPQVLSLPTPPGAEIVEMRGSANLSGNRRSWTFGVDGEDNYTVVYRIQRDKLRTATLRGEEEETGPALVEMMGDEAPSTALGSAAAKKSTTPAKHTGPGADSKGTEAGSPVLSTPASTAIPPQAAGHAATSAQAKPTASARSRAAEGPVPEPTANQKRQRAPLTEPPARDTASSGKKRPPADPGRQRSVARKKVEPVAGGAKNTEKRPGLKRVLRESSQTLSSIWNKEPSDTEPRGQAKQRPQWKGVGGAVTSESSSRFNKPAAGRGQAQTQQQQRGVPARRVQTPAPYARPSSRASYVSVHERRRDSIVSLADSFPRSPPSGGTRPSTPAIYRTDHSTPDAASPLSPRHRAGGGGHHHHHHHQHHHHHHLHSRPSPSYAPSLYSLATNDSQSSVLLASYYQKSAYNASGALNVLRSDGFVDGTFPAGHLLPNIARYMRYSSACYGSHFLKLLGISTELPASQVWDGTHEDVRHFAHHTDSHNGNILLASFVDPEGGSDATGSTGTGVPLVHYISLDHEAKAVVLACRGTLGFEDVLADLTCDYDDLPWRGRAYRVHKGVHASAKRLLYGGDGRVLVTLKEALLEFPDYGLVLCGHSLGGGVTSLLGVMLAEPNGDGPGF